MRPVMLALALLIGPGATAQITRYLIYIDSAGLHALNPDGTGDRILRSTTNADQPRIANGVITYRESTGSFAGTVYITDITGKSPARAANGVSVGEYDLSPDGQKMVYTPAGASGNLAMNTIRIDGTDQRTIQSDSGHHKLYPNWAPNGYIYFGYMNVGDAYSQRSYRIPEDGGAIQQLTTYFTQYFGSGGPTGRIAFLYNQPAPKLRTMRSDGTDQQDVPNSHAGIVGSLAYHDQQDQIYYVYEGNVWTTSVAGARMQLTSSGSVRGVDFGTAGTPPSAPAASFSWSPSLPASGQAVLFTDTSSGSPTSWAWDFQNDGVVDSTERNPTYVYTTAGTYSIRLTVANSGGSGVATKTITVAAAPCSFTVAPSSITVPSGGGSGTISVATTAGCAWTATTSLNWITMNPSGGSGATSVNYSVAANTGAASRIGIVTVAGHNVTFSQSAPNSRTPVLFVHGYCGSASGWDPLINNLATLDPVRFAGLTFSPKVGPR